MGSEGGSGSLVIGTTNPGKLRQMAGALVGTGLTLIPIVELLGELPVVDEIGDSAAEVAERKAAAYAAAVGCTTLSIDQWLTFDEVEPADQPGGRVRRIPGHPDGAPDEVLIDYYAGLARRYGGHLTARWSLGVALAAARGARSVTVEAVRDLCDSPSPIRWPGLPLASLQRDAVTGRYLCEHSPEEEDELWQRAYGQSVARLVVASLE